MRNYENRVQQRPLTQAPFLSDIKPHDVVFFTGSQPENKEVLYRYHDAELSSDSNLLNKLSCNHFIWRSKSFIISVFMYVVTY